MQFKGFTNETHDLFAPDKGHCGINNQIEGLEYLKLKIKLVINHAIHKYLQHIDYVTPM